MATRKTKTRLISELKSEFNKKQGSDKARWISNKLKRSWDTKLTLPGLKEEIRLIYDKIMLDLDIIN